MDDARFPMAEAAFKAALEALGGDRYNRQRREDVYDCVTLVTNALYRAGVRIETVVVYIRLVIHESHLAGGFYEETLIDHAISQYYR